ncbi:adenylyl cyclase [Elysia marginata]|uniref:Adenylyl cyclase n=1 Tax=Elysia marginata TaxID=1093978 RepID=A0AAV4EAC3_9GAST|nr:adenylyl cyclase [Elysia marginata]
MARWREISRRKATCTQQHCLQTFPLRHHGILTPVSAGTNVFVCIGRYSVKRSYSRHNRGKKELIEHYDAAQSSFTIKHREETRNIKTYFITGRKPGKTGIPGLMETADRRPPQFQKKGAGGGDTSAEAENGNSALATAELFAPPVPDPMSEDNDQDNKGEEDPGEISYVILYTTHPSSPCPPTPLFLMV